MKKRDAFVMIFLFMILSLTFGINNTYSLSIEEDKEVDTNNKLSLCEYSDEYKEWLTLTDEEREGLMMPAMCKTKVKDYVSKYTLLKATYADSRYSSVDSGYVTPIKDQMNTGSCWAFASLAAAESYMKKTTLSTYDYSERHMEYATSYYFSDGVNPTGFNRRVGDGGNLYISSTYMMNNQGPILESQMPFENNENLINLSALNNKTPKLDVNDFEILRSDSCALGKTDIKKHIVNYGAIASSVYMTEYAPYYNSSTSALFYNGGYYSNHAITIVGWDDNYSKNNFYYSNRPSSDGAWIVKNSYGTSFGDGGYMYVSYEDYIICKFAGGVTEADTSFVDNLYYHDTYGANTYVSGTSGYVANKFTKTSQLEALSEVTIAVNYNTKYSIYVIPNKVDSITLSAAYQIATGTSQTPGYKTIKLASPVLLDDTEFTIIVKYEAPEYAIPVSISEETIFANVTSAPGRSYISSTGTAFSDLYTYFSGTIAIASIRAGTDDVNYEINTSVDLSTYHYNVEEGGTYSIPITTKDISNNSTINVTIKKDGVNVTNIFTISGNKVSNNAATISVTIPPNKLSVGTYTLTLSYGSISKELTFTIYPYQTIYIDNTDEIPQYIYANESSTIDYKLVTSGYDDGTVVDVNIYNQSNVDVTSSFTITKTNVSNNVSTVKIVTSNTISVGDYKIVFKALEKEVSSTIVVKQYVPVSSIVLDLTKKAVYVRNGVSLNATVYPSNATIKGIEWSSSNTSIATVDDSGNVVVKSRGVAVITAKSKDPRVNITATFTVTGVLPTVTIDSSSIIGSSSTDTTKLYSGTGGNVKGSVTFEDVNNMYIVVTNSGGNDITSVCTITKSNIVNNKASFTVDVPSSLVTGQYTITIIGEYREPDTNILSALNRNYIYFNVYNPTLVTGITASNIKLTENVNNVKVTYTVSPSNATNKNVSFTSSDTDVVTVDADGTLHPKKIGIANITIKALDASNKSTTIKVIVMDEIFINTSYNAVNEIITNVNPGTTYSTLYNMLNITSGTEVKIYDNNNNIVTSGNIGTDYVIEKIKNGVTTKYSVIIFGDVNSDGTITAADYQLIKSYVMAKYNRPGYQNLITKDTLISAANVDFANGITAADYQIIKGYVMVKYGRPGYQNRITQNYILERVG